MAGTRRDADPQQHDPEAARGAGGSDLSGEARVLAGLTRRRDPGDSVPPGVAPEAPAPLSEEDRKVLEKLEALGRRGEAGPGRG